MGFHLIGQAAWFEVGQPTVRVCTVPNGRSTQRVNSGRGSACVATAATCFGVACMAYLPSGRSMDCSAAIACCAAGHSLTSAHWPSAWLCSGSGSWAPACAGGLRHGGSTRKRLGAGHGVRSGVHGSVLLVETLKPPAPRFQARSRWAGCWKHVTRRAGSLAGSPIPSETVRSVGRVPTFPAFRRDKTSLSGRLRRCWQCFQAPAPGQGAGGIAPWKQKWRLIFLRKKSLDLIRVCQVTLNFFFVIFNIISIEQMLICANSIPVAFGKSWCHSINDKAMNF